MTRRFILTRKQDTSGVSGTGVVAEGVQFPNGYCALTWKSEFASVAVYHSIDVLEKIHGHDGATEVVWFDPRDVVEEMREKFLRMLNWVLEHDPQSMEALIEYRRPVNEKVNQSPLVITMVDKDGKNPKLGLLGFINGFLGEDTNHIAAVFDEDNKLINFEPYKPPLQNGKESKT